MTSRSPLLMFASNSAWNLSHFRAPLIEEFAGAGFRLAAIVPEGDDVPGLERMGVTVERIALDRSGTSLIADARALVQYVRIIRRCRPAALLCFTAKPNIYGSLAARAAGVPVINNISGLGTGFLGGGLLEALMSGLYRLALTKSPVVYFQNEDDRRLFLSRRLVREMQAKLLAGSGIDLARFAPVAMSEGSTVRFLLVARMLKDKGVVEFVDAARQLRREGADAQFLLLGPAGDDNRSAIDAAMLEEWTNEGVVTWVGPADDVRPHMSHADVVVLPSYREGMPRSLIEAAAMGRPVIATDVPGCRQAVVEGVTGLLCASKSSDGLADAMRQMIALGPSRRAEMGVANRDRAEADFSHDRVVEAYRSALAACGVKAEG